MARGPKANPIIRTSDDKRLAIYLFICPLLALYKQNIPPHVVYLYLKTDIGGRRGGIMKLWNRNVSTALEKTA
jgi:hypothetical protein